MGYSQISGDWKRCSTCEYWTGRREIYNNSNTILVDTTTGGLGEFGKCLNRSSGWYNTSKIQHSSQCPKWEKWRVLQ